MSPPAARSELRWGDAAALVLLCGAGVGAWWGDFGSSLLWLAPVIGVAALSAAGLLGPRPALVLAIAWLPAALLIAGLPASALTPAALGTTVTSLGEGLEELQRLDRVLPAVWTAALAAVLLIGGIAMLLAGVLWRSRRWDRTLAGFALLLAPLGLAIALGQTPDASWPGAVVFVAVVLRSARGRLVPIAVATTMVGAVALFGAQVTAPRAGWQPFGSHDHAAQFRELSTGQTYGPLEGRRTGAVMLEVTGQPALWRMQVLEAFDNRRWRVANEDSELPEPAAQLHWIEVKVGELRNRLVVSPGGEIVHVRGGGNTVSELGDARGMIQRPPRGLDYRVGATTVTATAAQLAGIPRPTGRRYLADTQIGLGPLPVHVPFPVAKLADHVPAALRGTEWPRVFGLSLRLSEGVESELGVVRRVESYLQSDRFHYTTDVGPPGEDPLLEFLFHTHAGYCQHFAGAAALLLRVAGIPSRVAVGFATGEQIGKRTWSVRDEDAHAWIEVYFPTVGWVPFNPTPAVAEADVAPAIDILQAGAAGPTGPGGTLPLLAGAATILILLIAAGRRLIGRLGPRPQLAELLARLSPQPPGPRTTLRALHPTLTEIGPATADLAFLAERARFADRSAEPPHPRLAVWRALIADVGLTRSFRLMLRAARPGPAPRRSAERRYRASAAGGSG